MAGPYVYTHTFTCITWLLKLPLGALIYFKVNERVLKSAVRVRIEGIIKGSENFWLCTSLFVCMHGRRSRGEGLSFLVLYIYI